MAEEALYKNVHEPKFPFELVINRIKWLPAYLSSIEKKPFEVVGRERSRNLDLFPCILDTVLVWARARTAALHPNQDFKVCRSLVSRLNSVLEEVGPKALYHKLEIVNRGQDYFVTCRNSPRFNWKSRLTHLEIGRNLDFAASGHLFGSPLPRRYRVDIFELTTMRMVYVEVVLMESLNSPTSRERL